MLDDSKADNPAEALDLVDEEYDAEASSDAKKATAAKALRKFADWPPFGKFVPLSTAERSQLESLRDLVGHFARQQRHEHPLCLAVFGPPGSGKSFAVEQIGAEALKGSRFKLAMTTINLTQVPSSAELAAALAGTLMAAAQEPDTLPLVFFDECDTARDGAPYGWLSWFLAPMHDGEFFHRGQKIKFKRAIYVFAGGTSATMEEFSSRSAIAEFKNAKGPDFISRLRGFLDVPGPNAEPRTIRRAYVLRHELQKRVDRHGPGKFRVDRELLMALLRAGRYRHGARSIAALVELLDLSPGKATLDWSALPEDHLVALQLDRGPLDERAIGGSIAFSGFPPRGRTEKEAAALRECWSEVARELWKAGATIAYGGRWSADFELTPLLKDELSKLPTEASRNEESRNAPRPRFRSFLRGFDPNRAEAEADQYLSEVDRAKWGVELVGQSYLEGEERDWDENDFRARHIERFRRRLAVTEASVARFLVGGDRNPDYSRPSGIFEEAILALAFGSPIYVAGGFGGATHDLGRVLGLTDIRTCSRPDSLVNRLQPAEHDFLTNIAERLNPFPWRPLPVSPDQQFEFLRKHGLGGPGWIHNGLTNEKNRRLFVTDDPREVRRLVVEGLLRVFGDAASGHR
ncbi:MAG TPA: hypothetical protein VGY54_03630 [Polyangiaceae bacterium]|jgi:hypothetical protein|nr:hypothetical protein [Polyangiaceae bacterium]